MCRRLVSCRPRLPLAGAERSSSSVPSSRRPLPFDRRRPGATRWPSLTSTSIHTTWFDEFGYAIGRLAAADSAAQPFPLEATPPNRAKRDCRTMHSERQKQNCWSRSHLAVARSTVRQDGSPSVRQGDAGRMQRCETGSSTVHGDRGSPPIGCQESGRTRDTRRHMERNETRCCSLRHTQERVLGRTSDTAPWRRTLRRVTTT